MLLGTRAELEGLLTYMLQTAAPETCEPKPNAHPNTPTPHCSQPSHPNS